MKPLPAEHLSTLPRSPSYRRRCSATLWRQVFVTAAPPCRPIPRAPSTGGRGGKETSLLRWLARACPRKGIELSTAARTKLIPVNRFLPFENGHSKTAASLHLFQPLHTQGMIRCYGHQSVWTIPFSPPPGQAPHVGDRASRSPRASVSSRTRLVRLLCCSWGSAGRCGGRGG